MMGTAGPVNRSPSVGDFYSGYGQTSDLLKVSSGFWAAPGYFGEGTEADVLAPVVQDGHGHPFAMFSASEATIGLVVLLVVLWYFGKHMAG